jgi:adenosylcobyric acid synthase
VLPGSRQTRSDLEWLLESHWHGFIKEHVAKGGTVLGLCAREFKCLRNESIVDELGAESGKPGTDFALGLLPLTTRLEPNTAKIVRPPKG